MYAYIEWATESIIDYPRRSGITGSATHVFNYDSILTLIATLPLEYLCSRTSVVHTGFLN